MKAFLLAAGRGTRLGKLTEDTPKCLLSVNGKPMLEYWFEKLAQEGVTDVLVNMHYKSEKILEYLRKRPWNSLRITLSYEEDLLGTAATLYENRKFVRGEYAFAVAYADTWTPVRLRTMYRFHQRRPGMVTMGLYKPKNLEAKGVAVVHQGLVVGFEEKPAKPQSEFAFAGMMICHPSVFKGFDSSIRDISRDLLPRLVGKINAFFINDVVLDIGSSEEEFHQAQQIVSSLGMKAL